MQRIFLKPNEIVIISSPRSGTNFLCECLGEFEENLNLFEIFNRRGVFGANNHGIAADFARKEEVASGLL